MMPNVVEIAADAPCPVQSYGLDPTSPGPCKMWTIENGSSHFDVMYRGQTLVAHDSGPPGRHNCLNSLAVCAVMHHLGVSPSIINEGLEKICRGQEKTRGPRRCK